MGEESNFVIDTRTIELLDQFREHCLKIFKDSNEAQECLKEMDYDSLIKLSAIAFDKEELKKALSVACLITAGIPLTKDDKFIIELNILRKALK